MATNDSIPLDDLQLAGGGPLRYALANKGRDLASRNIGPHSTPAETTRLKREAGA